MNADNLYAIDDYSVTTLRELIERIKISSTLEQLIYRECELDEVWRLLDGELDIAKKEEPAAVEALTALRDCIHTAHDKIGDDMDTISAVEVLQQAIAQLQR